MINQVDIIIQKIETLLRGGAHSSLTGELHQLARSLLIWLASDKASDEYESSNDITRSEMLTSAVKLHNKARNLSMQSLGELRAILKASAGWILSIYGGEKPKVLAVVITLLSKSGQELIEFGRDVTIGLNCLSRAISMWTTAASLHIQKDVSPVDLQDMKVAIFWANLERATLLQKTDEPQQAVKKAITGAAEIVQTLPPRLKITFADRVYNLGRKITLVPTLAEEAVFYFKTAQNAVDAAMLPYSAPDLSDPDSTQRVEGLNVATSTEVKTLRLHIQLSLAYLYIQIK